MMMASPSVSTPSSAASPTALAPARPPPPTLSIKPVNASGMATMASSMSPGPQSMTSKEWIIPPRPKPGRKPATDTPPTRRKAQNRAAQRAFRERRAARVGELEEQLEETMEEQQKREEAMRDEITKLEADVQQFRGELQSLKLHSERLERSIDDERRAKDAALAELSYLRIGVRTTTTDAVSLPPRRNRPKLTVPEQQSNRSNVAAEDISLGCGDCTPGGRCACLEQAIAISTAGCGKCTPTTHCECLEEALKTPASAVGIPSHLKRQHSPPIYETAEKRPRHSTGPITTVEVDFTERFSTKPTTIHQTLHPQSPTDEAATRPPVDSCAFCEEGTFCMCAEASHAASEREREVRLPPLLNEVTPPPSDTEVEGSQNKLPSMQPKIIHRPFPASTSTNPCVNGPGTCQQCQNDPKSGLFCRSLAAMQASSGLNTPVGCCGGNSQGGGCCKSTVNPPTAPSHPQSNLSCADTYKTLSTHKNFDQASDDLDPWLGHLRATPLHHPGRAPIEVEAASVMGVLKFFDRRFGRGGN